MDIALRMFANCHISPPVGFKHKHKHAKTNQSSPSESLFSHMHLPGSIVHSISRWHLRLTSSMTKVASLLALDWLWSIWLKQYVKQFRVAKKSLDDWLYQVLLVFSYYCILAQSLAFWRVGWQAGISFAASGVVSPQWVLPRHRSMACDRFKAESTVTGCVGWIHSMGAGIRTEIRIKNKTWVVKLWRRSESGG